MGEWWKAKQVDWKSSFEWLLQRLSNRQEVLWMLLVLSEMVGWSELEIYGSWHWARPCLYIYISNLLSVGAVPHIRHYIHMYCSHYVSLTPICLNLNMCSDHIWDFEVYQGNVSVSGFNFCHGFTQHCKIGPDCCWHIMAMTVKVEDGARVQYYTTRLFLRENGVLDVGFSSCLHWPTTTCVQVFHAESGVWSLEGLRQCSLIRSEHRVSDLARVQE